jgi:hypothetical protein
MDKPQFEVGSYVYHLGEHVGRPDALAKVVEAFGDRYYVTHHGFVWSVPAWALRAAPPSRQRK